MDWESVNAGQVPGVSRIGLERMEVKDALETVVELSSDVSGRTFAHVLQFLYTGQQGPILFTQFLQGVSKNPSTVIW